MRIMTSNIWGDYFNNSPVGRDEQLYGVYQKYAPDVIGFQEVTRGWYESSLFENLSTDYYFVGTELVDSKNYVPMAIRKEFVLISKGFEYLENTPDSTKAITWAVVKKNDIVFALCNTHFWCMRGTESEDAKKKIGVLDFSFDDHCRLRAQNAEQLAELMKHLNNRYSCPVFAFGDMNSTITESVFDVYEQNGVKKLFDMAEQRDTNCTIHGDPTKDSKGTFRGMKATKEYVSSFRSSICLPDIIDEEGYFSSIDHIVALADSLRVTQYRVVEDQEALDATDHSPVYADIEFLV